MSLFLFTEEETEAQGVKNLAQVTRLVNVWLQARNHCGESVEDRTGLSSLGGNQKEEPFGGGG